MPEIARAAARAKADVVLLTDHDTLEAKRRGEEGWYGDVLLLAGEEVSPLGRGPLPRLPEQAAPGTAASTPAGSRVPCGTRTTASPLIRSPRARYASTPGHAVRGTRLRGRGRHRAVELRRGHQQGDRRHPGDDPLPRRARAGARPLSARSPTSAAGTSSAASGASSRSAASTRTSSASGSAPWCRCASWPTTARSGSSARTSSATSGARAGARPRAPCRRAAPSHCYIAVDAVAPAHRFSSRPPTCRWAARRPRAGGRSTCARRWRQPAAARRPRDRERRRHDPRRGGGGAGHIPRRGASPRRRAASAPGSSPTRSTCGEAEPGRQPPGPAPARLQAAVRRPGHLCAGRPHGRRGARVRRAGARWCVSEVGLVLGRRGARSS